MAAPPAVVVVGGAAVVLPEGALAVPGDVVATAGVVPAAVLLGGLPAGGGDVEVPVVVGAVAGPAGVFAGAGALVFAFAGFFVVAGGFAFAFAGLFVVGSWPAVAWPGPVIADPLWRAAGCPDAPANAAPALPSWRRVPAGGAGT